MGRYVGPVCRKCRRSGMKLYLKGVRCETPKCSMDRPWRSKPPGDFSRRRRGRASAYSIRLREKQKLRWYYGVLERQFRRYFAEAGRGRGSTGEILLTLMERRLDNVIYRAGFSPSRSGARQMVNHGHILVNGRGVDIPSYKVKRGEKIRVVSRPASQALARACLEQQEDRVMPQWLALDPKALEIVVSALPSREDISMQIDEQLIVEFCSR
ncbi:MAG: 30S ribosomal protein S4 [Planctomycetia bacterium]|nr:30S ribosomal protein S4 [Planctomycetia bacterium]